MLQNFRVTAFTVFEFLGENQQVYSKTSFKLMQSCNFYLCNCFVNNNNNKKWELKYINIMI